MSSQDLIRREGLQSGELEVSGILLSDKGLSENVQAALHYNRARRILEGPRNIGQDPSCRSTIDGAMKQDLHGSGRNAVPWFQEQESSPSGVHQAFAAGKGLPSVAPLGASLLLQARSDTLS